MLKRISIPAVALILLGGVSAYAGCQTTAGSQTASAESTKKLLP